MPTMSASAFSTLRTCPRKFYWQYIIKLLRPGVEGPREFGSLFHAGLEEWWRLAGDGDVPWIDKALVAALKGINEYAQEEESDKYEVAKAEALMIAYHTRWYTLEFKRVGKTGVEDFFNVPLLDPDGVKVPNWNFVGRKDAMVQFDDEQFPMPVDHKSTSQDISPTSDYWEKLRLDAQLSGYMDAARVQGFDCREALWDVIKRPDVTPKLETPMEEREYTLGKGCKDCGGSAGGKNGIQKGAGFNVVSKKNVRCETCQGTGYKEAPRLVARHNAEDEPVADFKARVIEKLCAEGNAEKFFKHAKVSRTKAQLDDARANLVSAAVEIDSLKARALETGDIRSTKAIQVYQQTPDSCFKYGRCDYIDICHGTVEDPFTSHMYEIKKREPAKKEEGK